MALDVEVPGEGYHQQLISCQQACPVNTDARGYVRAIAEERFEEAYLIARGPNPFASICGRICGAPCEDACRRGTIPVTDEAGRFLGQDLPVSIRALKRLACQHAGVEARSPQEVLAASRAHVPRVAAHADEMAATLRGLAEGSFEPAAGERVAIVGAGPAGLAAAHDLCLLGFSPLVYEAEPVPAGMLALGIPAYRLPPALIKAEVAVIEALGTEIRCNTRVGRDVTLEQLRQKSAAVVVAVGAKRSRSLGLPGERGPGVLGGVDFLRSCALEQPLELGREVLVIGGGNVAYDVARTVVRQVAYDAARSAARLPRTLRVTLASLETLEEMPADTLEILEGQEEGVERLNGWGPLEVVRGDDGRVTGVRFRRCLGVYDEQRRFAPTFDDSQQQIVPCDTVLMAVGQSPDLSFLEGLQELEMARPGWPRVDPETLATSVPGLFVAGDLAHGTALVIHAVASGKRAARSVYAHVTGRTLEPSASVSHVPLDPYHRERGYEQRRRLRVPTASPAQRLAEPWRQVETGYNDEQALEEAGRCLDCGVTPVFDGARCVLCGGCADVCPTRCLKLVSLDRVAWTEDLARAARATLGEAAVPGADVGPAEHSAILKDEDRCIRCALCQMRCPVQAISMERVCFTTDWRKIP
jgi:NADPH-dependent glutamate synthase beta subunit-like oxidoreductase